MSLTQPKSFLVVLLIILVLASAVLSKNNGTQVEQGTRYNGKLMARYVRISTGVPPLVLAEVEVFVGGTNVAPINGKPFQSTVMNNDHEAHGPYHAINGDLTATGFERGDGMMTKARDPGPWWEVDLGTEMPIDQINIWLQDRGRFPNPFSSWYVNEDMQMLVELLCARRTTKWIRRVHEWREVVVLQVNE